MYHINFDCAIGSCIISNRAVSHSAVATCMIISVSTIYMYFYHLNNTWNLHVENVILFINQWLQYKLWLGYPLVAFYRVHLLHPDEVNHNHISWENRDIWECLRASAAILYQPCSVAMCCDIPRHNTTVCGGPIYL